MPDIVPDDRAADRALLIETTRAAGELAAELFARNVRSWDKSPGNVVSEADLRLDAFLKERLHDTRPDYGWLSEETADDPSRLGCRRVWVVDPIDGTRDFVRGRNGFAVSVALVEDGQPILGALAAPIRNQLFAAEAGAGATRNGDPIRVSGRAEIEGIRLPADPAAIKARAWPTPWPAVAVEKPNAIALRIAKVACGEADAVFDARTTREWDVAAAALILREAGGMITDHLGQPLAFNQPSPRLASLVASTPALHEEVRARLAAGIAAWGPVTR